jgi:uncharacterized Zn finger protein
MTTGSIATVANDREWWAQRWIDVLESFGWAQRMARARVYAREGRVLSLQFSGDVVAAKVQGTASEPYSLTLSIDPFTEEQWGYIVETMAERAFFSAKLLAGEMPHNIEEVFTANGLSLFPFTKFDIHSECDCPDPINPCKHIGAVYYLLGDRFSQDPFVLFQLRGRTREQILVALRQLRQAQSPTEPEAETAMPSVDLPPDLSQFWHYDAPLDPSLVVIVPGQETVLDLLGPIPGDQGGKMMAALREIYTGVSLKAAQQAMTVD